jgi:hypothetical protein
MTGKIPTLLQYVILFSISESSYTNSLRMIGFDVILLTCGFTANLIIKNKQISKTGVRKIFQNINDLVMSLALILIIKKNLNLNLKTVDIGRHIKKIKRLFFVQ